MPNVPEISYGDTDPSTVAADVIADLQTQLGRTLYPGDPMRLLALAFAAESVDIRNMVDYAASQNLLAYATGSNLDALGDLIGVVRLAASPATCTVLYTADGPAAAPITIPAGTRSSPDGSTYFATVAPAVIGLGGTTVTVGVAAAVPGSAGNGYTPGEISTIIDAVGHIVSVSNTTTSSGGADPEQDGPYQARIRLGVTKFSVAGPVGAYEYWALSADASIADVYVYSPSPGVVNVYPLQQGGVIPGGGLLAEVLAVLSASTVRPLTDDVAVIAPTAHNYTVNLTYYIRTADAANATAIQAAVTAAVTAYTAWQQAAIGRDINPDVLIQGIQNAGAKRVVVTTPVFASLADTSHVAQLTSTTVVYGGLEDG